MLRTLKLLALLLALSLAGIVVRAQFGGSSGGGGGGGGSPTGSAGGDLAGTYPNPTLAAAQNHITSAAITGGAAGANGVVSITGAFGSDVSSTTFDVPNSNGFFPAQDIYTLAQTQSSNGSNVNKNGFGAVWFQDAVTNGVTGQEGIITQSVSSGTSVLSSTTTVNQCASWSMRGRVGSAVTSHRAIIQMCADQNWTASNQGTYIGINVTPDNTTTPNTIAPFVMQNTGRIDFRASGGTVQSWGSQGGTQTMVLAYDGSGDTIWENGTNQDTLWWNGSGALNMYLSRGGSLTVASTVTVQGADATGYSIKTSSGINLGTGCVLFGDGSQQCKASSGGSTSPGTPTNSIQYNNASSFGGDSLFLVQPSSVGIYQPIQLSSNTTIGQDTGHCGALLNIGTTGTRCAQAGNNFTTQSVLIHNNGGTQLTLADQSDSNEADMTVNSTGARFGTNISAIATSLTSGVDVPRIRAGGSGNVTVGLVASQDAGANAGLYINYPSTAAVGGTIFSNVSSTNTIANTNEVVLYTNVISAGVFKNAGDCVVLTCGMHGAADTNTKRVRIRFGTTTSSSIDGSVIDDTGAQAANATMLNTMAKVCKTGSNTQTLAYTEAQGAGVLGGAITNPTLTVTDTAAINVSCTCQNGTGTSGDCVGNAFSGDYHPAP